MSPLDRDAVSASYLALRAEVYPAGDGHGWLWRISEPRPGRTAIARRLGRSQRRWSAALAAMWALWRYYK